MMKLLRWDFFKLNFKFIRKYKVDFFLADLADSADFLILVHNMETQKNL